MGFGTCCIFLKSTCSDTIDQNVTYVRNTGFPTALSGASIAECTYTVKKCSDDICRVRLDFEQFNLLDFATTADSDADAVCLDTFEVKGLATGNIVPLLCGKNTGQHLYFEIGEESGNTATLGFKFDSTQTGSRDYEVRVTQYPCNSQLTPPEGCLQWHTGTDGRMMTFNFESDTFHLQNHNYNICVRREEGFCCIKYSVCSDARSFSLGRQAATSMVVSDCSEDYVQIENSDLTCTNNGQFNRYCGDIFGPFEEDTENSQICSCAAPFRVGIHSEATDDTGTAAMSRGACLEYSQVPCGASSSI